MSMRTELRVNEVQGFWVHRFKVQPRRRPEKFTRLGRVAGLIEKETDERPTSNIERPTSNNVFYRFEKKAEQAYFAEAATKAGSESTYRNYAVRLF